MSNLPEYKVVSVDKLIPYARNSRTINISLAADQIEKARKIGLGNTSAGVRTALDEYEMKE